MQLKENQNIHIIKDGKIKIIYDFYKQDLSKRIKNNSIKDISSKTQWQNIKTDSVTLGVNVALIQENGLNILIDTGIGTRTDYSSLKKYKIEQPRKLLTYLKNDYNILPNKIDIVILTHLHFDHSGGCVQKDRADDKNILIPTFPNAKYYISKEEYNYALEQSKKKNNTSFFTENFLPLIKNNRLEIIDYNSKKLKIKDEDYKLTENISIHFAGGHTRGFQYVKIAIAKEKNAVYFVGDIIPTPWHVNNKTFPGVDYDEKQLCKIKNKLLEEICKEDGIIIFQHSPSFTMAKITLNKSLNQNKCNTNKYRIHRIKNLKDINK